MVPKKCKILIPKLKERVALLGAVWFAEWNSMNEFIKEFDFEVIEMEVDGIWPCILVVFGWMELQKDRQLISRYIGYRSLREYRWWNIAPDKNIGRYFETKYRSEIPIFRLERDE